MGSNSLVLPLKRSSLACPSHAPWDCRSPPPRGDLCALHANLPSFCVWMALSEIIKYDVIIMPPPSVTEEVYCFPRRQLIFSFGRRVIDHSKAL